MGETTIQWCDFSFNPWVGCTKVSPGCANCYAETFDRRVGGVPKHQRPDPTKPLLRWGRGAPRTRTSPSYWKQPPKWNKEAERAGKRHRVFCASLADVFDSEVSDVWRVELFDLIRRTPNLDWLLLTKRPEHVRQMLSYAIDAFARAGEARMETVDLLQAWVDGRPPANVWLGVTVENQEQADRRIPLLLATPARVRFLSCEPLLEVVDVVPWLGPIGPNGSAGCGIDWIIIGGESGAKARPFALEWARSLVRQARAARVAPFVKQLGACPVAPVNEGGGVVVGSGPWGPVPLMLTDSHGGDWNEWPPDLRVREFPL